MKKRKLFILSLIPLISINGCKKENNENKVELTFTQSEYTLKSGDSISIKEDIEGVKYEIVNNPFDNIVINENNGIFTFDDSIPNYTQVMAIASYEEYVSEPCVVTLHYDYQASDVNFTNMSSYIVNNEYINAVSSKNYSVTYSLKEKIDGISIENDTGKVTYAPIVNNNTTFTVVADSHGSKTEKEFIAMTEGFVEAITSRQALEKDNTVVSAFYPLDFTKSSVEKENIIAVVDSLNVPLASNLYKYDEVNKRLELYPEILSSLNIGTTTFKIITERNAVEITLDVITKFINTVDDLVSISDSIENLSGYYILMNDLDLSDYLKNEGFNEGKGWTPIGLYTDTLDNNVATQYSFKGTFDGNGHIISGLSAKRKDTASFNAGLFGYTTNTSTIRNLGVIGSLDVSSYSGGLVGSNNGIIENCWADVDMNVFSDGEDAYRFVGGFVGNNFGTIRNCYSLGNVQCDRDYGSFVGSNVGLIENCFAYSKATTDQSDEEIKDNCERFIGSGSIDSSCIYFDDEDTMKKYNWSNVLSKDNWTFETNSLPSLKEVLDEYNLRAIKLNIENKKYFKGDKINFNVDIYPKTLEEEYIDFINYEVIGEGYVRIGDFIYTENAVDNSFTLEISLMNKGQKLTNKKTINVYDKIENLVINHNLEYLEAGKRYLLSSEITPTNNVDDLIRYEWSPDYLGVEIKDNILTIADEVNISSISFYAISESGTKSSTVTLPIKAQKIVSSGTVTIYENENTNLEFTFDNNVDLNNADVLVFNKSINYQIEDNKIIVSRSLLDNYKDAKARFLFKTSDGTIYGADAYYFSHERYTLEMFNDDPDVIRINSTKDFFTYFNADPNSEYDIEKTKNYNKTFLLTTDLDFNGKEIYGIGYGDVKFSGKFYGLGHTISNFKVFKNEKAMFDDSTDRYASFYYGVGLFASLSGSVYDLKLEDATIHGNNFVGGLVGMLSEGYVENCTAYNLNVTANEYSYTQDGVFVGKIIGKVYSGQIICTYHNNINLNTIG